ncbi:hypothetical protein AAF712_005037 [Marasmius tenuissimus]|uniref:Protein kinase domain-containing protein n=1 Tax=Marasmius tenuissimus TaxID=585030 RepID=A0ABR3A4E5_9AGAR
MQEGLRNTKTLEILERILGVSFEQVTDDDRSAVNYMGVHTTPLGSVAASLVIAEGSFSFGRFYCQPQQDVITDQPNCPTFVIGIAGPWLAVMGAVLRCNRTMDEAQVKRVARTLYALRRAIQTLKQSWDSSATPSFPKGCEHPRFFPYWHSSTDEHTREVVKFAYVKPLEDRPSCVTFLAKRLLGADGDSGDENNHVDEDSDHFVIKFVRRYEKDAHAMMGEQGFALKLLGFRPLRKEDPGYEDLTLLAMEYVEGKTLCDLYNNHALPADVKQGVQAALQVLNGAEYIFPDFRRPNVMVRESDERVRLIDIDWVCRRDAGVRYPFHLSPDIRDRSKAQDYDVITLDHQERMFEVL